MLGVYWTVDDVHAMVDDKKSKGRQKPSELFFPLSCIIEPKMPDILKKTVGTKYGVDAPRWAKQGEFEDMYDWGPQQFLKFVGGMVEPRAPTGHKAL
jgi:hypothetical protein